MLIMCTRPLQFRTAPLKLKVTTMTFNLVKVVCCYLCARVDLHRRRTSALIALGGHDLVVVCAQSLHDMLASFHGLATSMRVHTNP